MAKGQANFNRFQTLHGGAIHGGDMRGGAIRGGAMRGGAMCGGAGGAERRAILLAATWQVFFCIY